MMSEKKMKSIMVAIVVVCLLQCADYALAASYTVGDSSGWKFNTAGWENGKNFAAGDTLVFNYSPSFHNVVIVDKSSYDSCTVPANAKTLNSGKDVVTLTRGPNFFICGKPGHCDNGMKIAANAA